MPLTPPLPRICDLLAPHLGYSPNALPQQSTVLRCPDDRAQRFEQNGSSYEWNNWYGGRPVDNPLTNAFLMYDYENFHDNGFGKNVLYADFHVGALKASASVQGTTN